MTVEGVSSKSRHNMISQQQLHAVVSLMHELKKMKDHLTLAVRIDNIRCDIRSFTSATKLSRIYYLSGITIKVEPEPSDLLNGGVLDLKVEKSTEDDVKTVSKCREVGATVDLTRCSVKITAKAMQSTTETKVKWVFKQYEDEIETGKGCMEWTRSSPYVGEDCVFNKDKYPQALKWSIKKGITERRTISWLIHTHLLRCSNNYEHTLHHHIRQKFEFEPVIGKLESSANREG